MTGSTTLLPLALLLLLLLGAEAAMVGRCQAGASASYQRLQRLLVVRRRRRTSRAQLLPRGPLVQPGEGSLRLSCQRQRSPLPPRVTSPPFLAQQESRRVSPPPLEWPWGLQKTQQSLSSARKSEPGAAQFPTMAASTTTSSSSCSATTRSVVDPVMAERSTVSLGRLAGPLLSTNPHHQPTSNKTTGT